MIHLAGCRYALNHAGSEKLRLLAVITLLFSSGTPLLLRYPSAVKPVVKPVKPAAVSHRIPAGNRNVMTAVRHLAGPYARLVVHASHKAHVSPRLVAAVVHVENGGDFHGSTTRVSPAGAIGVMQLEPVTARDVLRVNPWSARQNIEGGAHYLAILLRQFHGDVQKALMAYNAGPTLIAQGGRPWAAVAYARQVIRLMQVERV